MYSINRQAWLNWIDAGRCAYNIQSKFFSTSPTNDFFFWPVAMMATYNDIVGEKRVAISANDSHSLSIPGGTGGPIGHTPHRTYMQIVWMNYWLQGQGNAFGDCVPVGTPVKEANDLRVRFQFNGPDPVLSYKIYYSSGETPFRSNFWRSLACTDEGNTVYSALVPVYYTDQPLWWYGLITDSKQVTVSTTYQQANPLSCGFTAADNRQEGFSDNFEDSTTYARWRKPYASYSGSFIICPAAAFNGTAGLYLNNAVTVRCDGLRGVVLEGEGSGLRFYANSPTSTGFVVKLMVEDESGMRFFWQKNVTGLNPNWQEVVIPWTDFEFTQVSFGYNITPITWNGARPEMLGSGIGMLRLSNATASEIYIDDIGLIERNLAKAWHPRPGYDGQGVGHDVLLTWNSGNTATSHEVYFGTSQSAVASAGLGDPEYKDSVTVNNWLAENLNANQAYWWRGDEFDGSIRTTGDVWKFTAADMKAWSPSPSAGATGVSSEIVLNWKKGAGANEHIIYFGSDYSAVLQRTVGSQRLSENGWDPNVELLPETDYYWCVDENLGGGVVISGDVWDFTVGGGAASAIEPVYGATGVTCEPVLKWGAPQWCTDWDVYFGDNSTAVAAATPNSPEFCGNFSQTVYDLNQTLTGETHYYWRVDSYSPGHVWTGPVWYFTTNGIMRSEQVIDANLAGYWRLDDANGTTAYDWSTNGHDGQIGGSAAWISDGKLNGTLAFDGVDDVLQINDINYCGDGNSCGVTFWFRSGALEGSGEQVMFAHGQPGGQQLRVSLGEDGSGYAAKVRTFLRAGNSYELTYTSDSTFDDGQWHLYSIFLSDVFGCEIYIDHSFCVRDFNSGGVFNPTGDIYVGAEASGGYFGAASNAGALDDVRIYKKRMEQWELYNIADESIDHRRAHDPIPDNGAKDQHDSLVLNWDGGTGAGLWDVYLSQDPAELIGATPTPADSAYKGRFDVNSYHVYDLARNKDHYWAVDSVSEQGRMAGSIWKFGVGRDGTATSNFAPVNYLRWDHVVGFNRGRMLIVGVACEDTEPADMNIVSVTYNGVAMTPIDTSEETVLSGTYLKTKLFYMTGDKMPGAGQFEVEVNFSGYVIGAAAGALNFEGVLQTGPESVATGSRSDGSQGIITDIYTVTDGVKVVAVIGCGNPGEFTTTLTTLDKRWDASGSEASAAGGTTDAGAAGQVRMIWRHSNYAQLSQSVAAFALEPVRDFNLAFVSYDLIAQRMVDDGRYLQSYRMQLQNNAAGDVNGFSVHLDSNEPSVQMVNQVVMFDTIGPGATALSQDIFVVLNENSSAVGPDDVFWTPGDNVEGDLTGDGLVNFSDVMLLSEQWLIRSGNMHEDIYRDSSINMRDLAILAGKWAGQ